jgi:hypothetical protein
MFRHLVSSTFVCGLTRPFTTEDVIFHSFNRLGRIASFISSEDHRHIEPNTYLIRGSEVWLNDIHVNSWVEGYTPTALAVVFLHFWHRELSVGVMRG